MEGRRITVTEAFADAATSYMGVARRGHIGNACFVSARINGSSHIPKAVVSSPKATDTTTTHRADKGHARHTTLATDEAVVTTSHGFLSMTRLFPTERASRRKTQEESFATTYGGPKNFTVHTYDRRGERLNDESSTDRAGERASVNEAGSLSAVFSRKSTTIKQKEMRP